MKFFDAFKGFDMHGHIQYLVANIGGHAHAAGLQPAHTTSVCVVRTIYVLRVFDSPFAVRYQVS